MYKIHSYNKSSNNTSCSGNFRLEGNSNLKVPGDITAFVSDMRLKTSIEQIDNAVAKVCTLSGFTYQHNDLAKTDVGLDSGNQRFSGVSAQAVQEVLPEAVRPAPGNDKYLTVQYEKLVPLLIEAIKELKDEVDDLKRTKAERIYKPE